MYDGGWFQQAVIVSAEGERSQGRHEAGAWYQSANHTFGDTHWRRVMAVVIHIVFQRIVKSHSTVQLVCLARGCVFYSLLALIPPW